MAIEEKRMIEEVLARFVGGKLVGLHRKDEILYVDSDTGEVKFRQSGDAVPLDTATAKSLFGDQAADLMTDVLNLRADLAAAATALFNAAAREREMTVTLGATRDQLAALEATALHRDQIGDLADARAWHSNLVSAAERQDWDDALQTAQNRITALEDAIAPPGATAVEG